jgi:RNA polymerase sigma-70 factor, ECF subfamily
VLPGDGVEGGLGGLGDDGLAALASHGDGRAFDALCDRYRKPLQIYCFRVLRDREGAEDAVQDALLRAWLGLIGRSQQTDFRGWLFAIARNVAIDALSRDRDRARMVGEVSELATSSTNAGDEAGTRIRMQELRADLRALPQRQREALALHEMFGLSFAQIALLRGGSAKAVRQAARDGRKGLVVAAAGRVRPCRDVEEVLSASDRRGRRQGWVISHLRDCAMCRSLSVASLGSVPTVAPGRE